MRKKNKKEKYIGVKFKTIYLGNFIPGQKEKIIIKKLIRAGKEIGKIGIKDKNGGNLSYKTSRGMIIKNTGAYPYKLKPTNFSLITNIKKDKVFVLGKKEPSSESRLHFYLYQSFPQIKSIIHCHDFNVFSYPKKIKGVGYLKTMSYGTEKLALAALKLAKKFNYIIEENHGVIAMEKNIRKTLALIKKYHSETKV